MRRCSIVFSRLSQDPLSINSCQFHLTDVRAPEPFRHAQCVAVGPGFVSVQATTVLELCCFDQA